MTFDLLPHTKVPCYLEHKIVEHFNELSSVFNIVDEGDNPVIMRTNIIVSMAMTQISLKTMATKLKTMATTLVNMNMKKNFVKVSTSL